MAEHELTIKRLCHEEDSKQVGWVKIYSDASIEWDFDRNDEAYPEAKKILREYEKHEAGVQGEYTDPADGDWATGVVEPEARHYVKPIIGSISSIDGLIVN